MELFTIYYGTPQGKDTKIGVDCSYPKESKHRRFMIVRYSKYTHVSMKSVKESKNYNANMVLK